MNLFAKLAPRTFDDGLDRCNRLGMKMAMGRTVRRFLDLGCGDGRLTIEFARRVRAGEVFGIEISRELVDKCAEQGIQCRRCDLNGELPFETDTIDLVLSSQSVEHLHDTRHYLAEAYRCLEPGGQFVVLTENLASWANIMCLVLGWQPFSTTNICGWNIGNPCIWHRHLDKNDEYVSTGVAPGSHVRVLAYGGLRDALRQTGFVDVQLRTRGYLPFWGWFSDLLCTVDRRHGHFLVASARKPQRQRT